MHIFLANFLCSEAIRHFRGLITARFGQSLCRHEKKKEITSQGKAGLGRWWYGLNQSKGAQIRAGGCAVHSALFLWEDNTDKVLLISGSEVKAS